MALNMSVGTNSGAVNSAALTKGDLAVFNVSMVTGMKACKNIKQREYIPPFSIESSSAYAACRGVIFFIG